MDRTGNTPNNGSAEAKRGISRVARLCEFTDRSSQGIYFIFIIQFQQNGLKSFKVTFLVFLHMLAKHDGVGQGCTVEHARPGSN